MTKSSLHLDSLLIEKLLLRDEATTEQFVQQFLPIVQGHVSYRFPTLLGYSEDLALDAIYEVLRTIDKYDPERAGVLAWMNHRADCRAKDRLKQQLQQETREQRAKPPLMGMIQSPDEGLKRLARLTSDERKLLELHYVDGFSYRQIAELAGTSHTTLITRTRAILAKLSD